MQYAKMQQLNQKDKTVLWQITFWVILISTINAVFVFSPVRNSMVFRNFIALGGMILGVLINVYVLIPKYFVTKNYKLYVGFLIVLIGNFVVATTIVESNFFNPQFETFLQKVQQLALDSELKTLPPMPLHSNFPIIFLKSILITIAVAISTVFESIEINREQEKIANQIRNEQLETEMKFLKNQINPHFLFNVLNNIYGLALAKSDQTPEVVLRLSEMLRFMLYDSVKEVVPLKKEIDYIKNYIAIQQLKDKHPLSIETNFAGANENTLVAPLLLIPFVENAFKHSKIEDLQSGWITIKLNGQPGEVNFLIRNSLPMKPFTKDKTGGIGLKNVSRRLELQYPKKHFLSIQKREKEFEVSLNLQTR